jgi:immune inhibitor A
VLVGSAIAAVIAAAAGPATAVGAVSAPESPGTSSVAAARRSDNRPGPLTSTQVAQRKAAIDLVAKGKAKANADGVVTLSSGKSVEIATTRTDKIFTILADFGTQSSGRYGTMPGPGHNQIPEPDRTLDNSTYWKPDFGTAHYESLFNGSGESMKNYYEKLSNGAYSVTNTVADWVTVPYNGSYYGDNATEDAGGVWQFIQDTGDAWYAEQLASGKTSEDIDAYLAQFDVWDRYDADNDGNFDEPDGYIDHFQAIHAGEGEEAGGGTLGADAIWSHRWYVNATDYGQTGPAGNLMGGAQIGKSKYWFGDYTTEPENGGLGVFAHEFGHDLGLPDYYDTSGGENSTAFWTLMSSGSWLGHGAAAGDGIGTTPGLMGAEEKLFLGWLDHSTVDTGMTGTYTLNPSQLRVDRKDQAVRVNLPDKTVTRSYTTPPSATHAWWTGSADGLNEKLARSVPAGSRVSVQASAWYDIEAGYDYLYGEYSLDGGNRWIQVGQPVDGSSNGRWTTLRWSYDAGGKPSMFRLRYQTDGGVHLTGAFLDDIAISSGGVNFVDDVESGLNGWTPTGLWKISTGTESGSFANYYLLENREYVGYDATLAEGPYQFSKGITRPDWVEFFRFQNGMLVWYVDRSYEDNNVAQHPGHGAAMVVDARPVPFTYPDGTRPSNRRQPFDATFGLETTDATCLHKEVLSGNGPSQTVSTVAACAPATAGLPTFDDAAEDAYYSTANPQGSVKVAGHGVKVTVTGDKGDDLTISVVNP